MHIKEMQVHPFGQGYKDRNRIEDYLRQIFTAVDNDDGMALQQLYEEMDLEQTVFINGLLASHTRAKIKALT